MSRLLNLARRPFLNLRPVRRAALLLWIAGGILLLVNVFAYRSYWLRSAGKRESLASLEEKIAATRRDVSELERKLGGLDLADQNAKVEFLDTKIAERTFSWSRLFDRLEEVLPRDVRIVRLSPRIQGASRSRNRAGGRGDEPQPTEVVGLDLNGSAQDGEALLEFVDALFAHPAFRDPNLTSEAKQPSKVIDFHLGVTYLPQAAAAAPVEGSPSAPPPAPAGGETGR